MALAPNPRGLKLRVRFKVKRKMKMEDRRWNRRDSVQAFLGKAVSGAINTSKT
jgi:hypothetical protein